MMDQPNLLEAEVLVTDGMPPEQERVIVDAFRGLGVAARTRLVPARRGLGDMHWLMLATLPLQAFLGSVGSKLAEDAYPGLKRLVQLRVSC